MLAGESRVKDLYTLKQLSLRGIQNELWTSRAPTRDWARNLRNMESHEIHKHPEGFGQRSGALDSATDDLADPA